MTTMKPLDMLERANHRINHLEKVNARLENQLGQLRNIYPGRSALEVLEALVADWELFTRTAVFEDGTDAVDEDGKRMIFNIEQWASRLIDRLWRGREILRGPGARERAIATHREAIEQLSTEGIE